MSQINTPSSTTQPSWQISPEGGWEESQFQSQTETQLATTQRIIEQQRHAQNVAQHLPHMPENILEQQMLGSYRDNGLQLNHQIENRNMSQKILSPSIENTEIIAFENFWKQYTEEQTRLPDHEREYPMEQWSLVHEAGQQSIRDTTFLINQAIQTLNAQPREQWDVIVEDALQICLQTTIRNFEERGLNTPTEVINFWKEYEQSTTPESLSALGYGAEAYAQKKQADNPHTPTVSTAPNIENFPEFPNPKDVETHTLTSAQQYINTLAGNVLHYPTEYEYLKEKDPAFYEVLQVFWGTKTTLSADAFRALQAKSQDPTQPERTKNIEEEVAKIEKMKEDTPEAQEKKKQARAKLLYGNNRNGMDTFQLAMQAIAQNVAKKEMAVENTSQTQLEQIKNDMKGKGHFVPLVDTKTQSNLLNAERAGRLTIGNALIDQVVRMWGMLVVGANVMAATKDGDWASRAPLIALGGAVTYGAAKGVLDGGIDKMFHPGNMPENIMKESFQNAHYVQYFSNPWEIALAKQMKVPADSQEKSTFQKNIKEMKERKSKNENGEDLVESEGVLSGQKIRRKDKNLLKNTLCGNDFHDFLPNEKYQTPDGEWVSKEEFLQGLDAQGVNSTIRLKVMETMIGRLAVGSNGATIASDSHFQYLDQLHMIANNNTSKNPKA